MDTMAFEIIKFPKEKITNFEISFWLFQHFTCIIFLNHTFCVFVRLASARRFQQISQRMFSYRITWDCQSKNTRSADFCADRIDVITNFAVITNVVIKRVHCS